MTIETKYNIGDEVWFSYMEEVPVKGRIDGIVIRHNLNMPTSISYLLKFRSSPNDIRETATDHSEENLFLSADEYINRLDRIHSEKIDSIRDAIAKRPSPLRPT